MKSILFLEDSSEYQFLVKKILGSDYKVIVTEDPDSVLPFLNTHKIDLILLDISLPKRDGYSVLNEIQASAFSAIPVICLTGKNEVTDKVTAFSLGADDYIHKPFDLLEFKARVDSKIKKSAKRQDTGLWLKLGDLKIDLMGYRIFSPDDSEIELTSTEFKLLTYFARHPEMVFSRDQLLAEVWGDEGAVFDRAVDVHICSLRKKLTSVGITFKSVTGIGYRIIVAGKNSLTA